VFNISEIIQNQVPDAEGNIVPPTVQMGSAKLVGARADNESILVAMDSGVYNVRKATCGGSCMSCDGFTQLSLLLSPFSLAIGGQKQETFQALWNNGTWYNYTGLSNWSSNQPTVATVQSGLGHGVSAGSVVFNVTDSSMPVYIPYTCFGFAASCPIAQGAGAQAPGTVVASPTITGILPNSGLMGNLLPVTISGTNFGSVLGNLSIGGASGAPINGTVNSVIPAGTSIGATLDLTALSPGGYTVVVNLATGDGGHLPSNPWPFTVTAPTISGPTVVWWFNGQTVSGFATQIALTASGGGNGTYVWSVTGGPSKVALQGTTSGQNVTSVQVKSASYSTTRNDVTVQLQFTPSGGNSSALTSYSLSVDSPYKLVPNGVTNKGSDDCASSTNGTYGYKTQAIYTAQSFFGVTLGNIGVNETFGADIKDYVGTTWPANTPGGRTIPGSGQFADTMCVVDPGLTLKPHVLIPQSPLTTVKIDHSAQSWYIGSVTPGSGLKVQTDTQQYYQDHALHLSIVSPVR
jgi:hypothetical protein